MSRLPAAQIGGEQAATSPAKPPRGILKPYHVSAQLDSSQTPSSPSLAGSKRAVIFEPTYKTLPDESFCSVKAEGILKDILETHLKKARYDAKECSRLTHNLCSVIKTQMKTFGFGRYRYVVQVLIGQDTDQGLELASRCLWNPQTDNFAAATFRNSSLYSIALVYALYLE